MKLEKSPRKALEIAADVEDRFLNLCGTYRRVRGMDLPIPPEVKADMLLWRRMVARYHKGDYRHDKEEIFAMERFMRWCNEINTELRGGEEEKPSLILP